MRRGDGRVGTKTHDRVGHCVVAGHPRRTSAVSQSSAFHTMTSEFSPSDEMSSVEDFEAALGRLVLAATKNGIDPEGTWEYRTNGSSPDVEVMVVELAE